ncbi:MAG: aminotransferase class IV [Spirochaetes bacterium]|nr:aminotransferase class IV [Spirochaetota bacterium]
MKAWHDGIIVDEHSITVSPLSHSFSRGTAIFEVLEIVDSYRGPAIFGLAEHIERLYRSAELLFIPLSSTITPTKLSQAICDTVRANKLSNGIIKLFIFFPTPEYSCIPFDKTLSIAIFCSRPPAANGIENHSFTAMISRYRKNHPECVPVHAKATGFYVNSYLALWDARTKGFDEAILLDTMGYIAEGATSNIFIVKDSILITPQLRAILPGITRKFILDIASQFMQCREADITMDDLLSAEEVFFSNSIQRIMPIRQIGNSLIFEKVPGVFTQKIIRAINDVIYGKMPDFLHWLTFID